ncbi:hypothetical protein ACFVVA_38210 [Kitasatospora sp. NPDC058048]|uniref:restriction system modified-DNA reader domain-containing protein n=1 Tax=Kitasatospora sp. NPDC058048 TaxID=3346313 RepID=UPI0036DE244E
MAQPNRTIQIDDEVFALLQRHSEPLVDTPNDVLRRLLLDGGRAVSDPAGSRPTGALMPLIEAGLVRSGDQLRHTQTRLKFTYTASVAGDGWIEIPDGRAFRLPSPALKAQVGYDVSGWTQYVHVPSGATLSELREQLADRS